MSSEPLSASRGAIEATVALLASRRVRVVSALALTLVIAAIVWMNPAVPSTPAAVETPRTIEAPARPEATPAAPSDSYDY